MRGVLGELGHLLLERRRRRRNLVVRQLLVHHGVGEELDGFREVGAEAVHGVRHLLPRRGREEVGADHLRLASHAKRRAVGGGSPRHALEEVGRTGHGGRLPLGAGGDVHADGDGGARRVLRGDLGSVAERGDVGHRRGGGRGGGIGDGQTGHRLVHRGHRRTRGASEDGAHHGRLGDRGGQSGEGHPRSGGGAHAARRGAESFGEDHL
mmetsp:Transcript_129104/g.313578  ORF Transcript_129104/g.313578 Transcript_129104/m.313578 type:complete len:209 (+) Transcript_129104:959-1585(+)